MSEQKWGECLHGRVGGFNCEGCGTLIKSAVEELEEELSLLRVALAAVTKERDNYKWEYENVCKFANDLEDKLSTAQSELSAVAKERDEYRDTMLAEHQAAVDMFFKYDEAKDQLTEALANEQASATAYAEVKAELEVARERVTELENILRPVTLDEMGGEPDMFWPTGGWEAWDEIAKEALAAGAEPKSKRE